jgi:hypothetical protein
MMATGLLGEPPIGLGEEPPGTSPPTLRILQGWGGHADYVYVQEGRATRLPTGITDEASGSRSRSAQPWLACLNAYP